MGMADYGIGDVAQESPLQPAEPAAAYHYQAGADILGEVDDRLVSSFSHPQVGDRDGATRILDLPDLLVQYLLSLAPDLLPPHLGVDLVNCSIKGAPDRHDVEPRIGALRKVDRRHGRQLSVRRTVSGQQDPRRENTQPTAFRSTYPCIRVIMVTINIKGRPEIYES